MNQMHQRQQGTEMRPYVFLRLFLEVELIRDELGVN